jgi:WD40 repeat protein
MIADLKGTQAVGVSWDGASIVAGGESEAARNYRMEMSRMALALPVRSGLVRDNVLSAAVPVVDYSPDGRWIATALWGVIQLRDSSGAVVAAARQGNVNNRCSVRFSPDGGHLALLWENGQLTLWDLRALRGELAARGLDW